MTKEELEKEVEDEGVKYADSIEYKIPKFSDENGYCWSQVELAYEKGALDFAEPREKRIAELEKQIEKMKSCRSCKHDRHCNHRVCDKSLPLWEFAE